jgi:hypothetical protein
VPSLCASVQHVTDSKDDTPLDVFSRYWIAIHNWATLLIGIVITMTDNSSSPTTTP